MLSQQLDSSNKPQPGRLDARGGTCLSEAADSVWAKYHDHAHILDVGNMSVPVIPPGELTADKELRNNEPTMTHTNLVSRVNLLSALTDNTLGQRHTSEHSRMTKLLDTCNECSKLTFSPRWPTVRVTHRKFACLDKATILQYHLECTTCSSGVNGPLRYTWWRELRRH